MDARSAERFRLVAAAHRFIMTALPLADGQSRRALDTFSQAAACAALPTFDIDTVLVRTLAVVDRHSGGRLPTMVECYLSATQSRVAILSRFYQCIDGLIRYRGVDNPLVQRAIAIIEASYSQSTLTTRRVAALLEVHIEMLGYAFNRQMGLSVSEFIRSTRLNHAAELLRYNKTVKEVWTSVGYNHASNFDHDFKRFFQISPTEYRSRVISPLIVQATTIGDTGDVSGAQRLNRGRVLIVDDDPVTRDTVGQYLRLEGYTVCTVESGTEALSETARMRPDAVVLDYHLPDMDGFEWLRTFRRSNARTPVIVFSADCEVDLRQDEIMGLSASFVSKLTGLDDIANSLAMVIGPRDRASTVA